MPDIEETYLGDGLWAVYDPKWDQIKVYFKREEGVRSDVIYFERGGFRAFKEFGDKCWPEAK